MEFGLHCYSGERWHVVDMNASFGVKCPLIESFSTVLLCSLQLLPIVSYSLPSLESLLLFSSRYLWLRD